MTDRITDQSKLAQIPADYSLEDIEEILRKVRKRYGKTGTPIPDSTQENAELLRRPVRARDAAIPTQPNAEPITNFDSDTTVPALTSTPSPALTTTTTATDSNSAIMEIEQQDDEELGVRRVGKGTGVEMEDGVSNRKTER
jgi:hypothetical protein